MLVIIIQIIKNINKKRKNSCIISQNDIIQDIYYLSHIFTYLFFYPSATSNIIIITNPTATPIVPILECSPTCDSGINSSTTT